MIARPPRAISPRRQQTAGLLRTAAKNAVLFHALSTRLANGGILIAGATAAADRADQLSVFDKRKSTGARDQSGIERGYIGMSGFIGVVKHPRLPAKACRGASLTYRNRPGRDLRALHPPEMYDLAVGFDQAEV